MTLFHWQDLRLIVRPLLWCGAILLFAGLLLITSRTYLALSEQELAAQQARNRMINTALAAAQRDWQTVQHYQQRYAQLQQIGVLEHEHRLEWVEALTQLAVKMPALQLDFSFAAQRIKEGVAAEQQQILYASAMKLRYVAATARDFSEVNAHLAQLPGRALARSCHLQRAPEQSTIAVECVYDWLTIARQKAPSTSPSP